VKAIDNLPRILKEVPGIGVVLIGEGDLSQNLGHPRQYDHPAVVDAPPPRVAYFRVTTLGKTCARSRRGGCTNDAQARSR